MYKFKVEGRDECMYIIKEEKICDNCPIGARCPGWKQLWPLPGFGILKKRIQQKDVRRFVLPCPAP